MVDAGSEPTYEEKERNPPGATIDIVSCLYRLSFDLRCSIISTRPCQGSSL